MLSRLSSLSKGPETRKQLGNEFAQHWVLGSPGARALVTGPGGGEGIQQGDGAAELAVGSGDPGADVPTILALFLVWLRFPVHFRCSRRLFETRGHIVHVPLIPVSVLQRRYKCFHSADEKAEAQES